MRPSRYHLLLIFILASIALLLAIARYWSNTDLIDKLVTYWWVTGVGFFALLLIDYLLSASLKQIDATRYVSPTLSLGSHAKVTLTIHNPFMHSLHLCVFDHHPQQLKTDAFPFKINIPKYQHIKIDYDVKTVQRGDAKFGQIELRILSRLKFWEFNYLRGPLTCIKIYPNFANIALLSELQIEKKSEKMGIHLQQRRGSGTEFHQLRDYRTGDSISQINWQATARHVKLISKDYQDERDQEILFMLDCGRRMRTVDEELSHFDYSLNALLLTSFIALKQGDSVGLMSFAGDTRWISPIKGPKAINHLLNQVYDLESTIQSSDLIQAASDLINRHRKRALVILMTNIRDEDQNDLVSAVKILSQRHLVMIASLRENFIDNIDNEPITDFPAAIKYSNIQSFIEQRKQVFEAVTRQGVIVVDSLPRDMHVSLANQYFKLKRSGRI